MKGVMNLKDRRKLKDRCPEYRKKTKPNGRYSREGFLSAMPFGCNRFGSQFERVLPASAIGNMFPFNFSGKTDPKGFYIGRDKYGTNILVDLDRRADDKTNSNILILGNSGQGNPT